MLASGDLLQQLGKSIRFRNLARWTCVTVHLYRTPVRLLTSHRTKSPLVRKKRGTATSMGIFT